MIRLEAARNISTTNKPTNEKLNGWKPLETKPRKDELWQAILECDSTKRPKNWSVQDMVKDLMKTSPTTSGAQGVVGNSEGHDTVVSETTAFVAVATLPSTDALAPKRWSRGQLLMMYLIMHRQTSPDETGMQANHSRILLSKLRWSQKLKQAITQPTSLKIGSLGSAMAAHQVCVCRLYHLLHTGLCPISPAAHSSL